MTTTVEDFVVYGKVGTQAQTYCTDKDEENDYSNNFKFHSILSEEVSGSDNETVEVKETTSGWKSYGRWILLGAGALILLVGGGVLIFSGSGKKPKKTEKSAEKAPEKTAEAPEKQTETAEQPETAAHEETK